MGSFHFKIAPEVDEKSSSEGSDSSHFQDIAELLRAAEISCHGAAQVI